MRTNDHLLQINDLTVSYFKDGSEVRAVDNVRLKIPSSGIFALVGESGCGKTTLGLSITDLIDPMEGRITHGSVVLQGKNILRLPPEEMRRIRGREISYIFQEPATSLNPVFTIGEQIKETLLVHNIAGRHEARARCMTVLGEVGFGDPERIYDSFAHELSGGMKQRAMIAMAISTRPKLLIADEPTTALDVDSQQKILDLLIALGKELSLSVLIITHDMRIVKTVSDMTAVMFQGKIVEVSDTAGLFNDPRHQYTQMLLDCLPERLKL